MCPHPCLPLPSPCPGAHRSAQAPDTSYHGEGSSAAPIASLSPVPSVEHRETLLSTWCHHNPESCREPRPSCSCTEPALATLSCAAEQHLIPQSLFSFIMLARTLGLKSGNVGTCCFVPHPTSTHPEMKYSSP